MSLARPVTVAVDAVGGDNAPGEILSGIALALSDDPALHVLITGPAEVIDPFCADHPGRTTPVVTTEIIEMGEHPANAVRTKKDSSIVVGSRLVKEGRAEAFFSAGSTGACMAAATLVIGRIKGVSRPAIATVLPTAGPPCVMLDVGANADCKAQQLVQFAHMGAAYATVVLGVEKPRVALLNIGEEPTKGSALAQETYALLTEQMPDFVGNVEGNDVLVGVADVIVTDGFTGNVALKLLEGTSRVLLGQVKAAMTANAVSTLAAALLKPAMVRLKQRLDPDTYGGAPLLGINGISIIGHGSSNSTAVANALRVAASAARGGLTEKITAAISSAN